MFGQNNQSQQNDNQIPDQSIDGALGSEPHDPSDNSASEHWQHPGQPLDNPAHPSDAAPAVAPPADNQTPALVTPTGTDDPGSDSTDGATTNDLLDIKQQALGQLSPLVGHLDQSPEEKFRTTMMMIQASDNQSLVRTAFEAAQAIPDEKARAQALLDVINEINYFTQHQGQSQ
jgi:hypothetical protein